MLRSSRLIAEKLETLENIYILESQKGDVKKYNADNIAYEINHVKRYVQPGDTMTGWEIIAGLPLEEQKKIKQNLCFGPLDDALRNLLKECDELFDAMIEMMCALYRWNGTSWEVVE